MISIAKYSLLGHGTRLCTSPNSRFGGHFCTAWGCSCARLFWSECGKMRTGVTPNADTFHLVLISLDNSWDNQVTYFYIIYIVPNLLVENQNIELKHRRIMIFKENKKKTRKNNKPTNCNTFYVLILKL